jgi:hypothetical protein
MSKRNFPPVTPSPPPPDPLAYAAWLDGIVRPREGARLRGCSEERLKDDARAKGQLLQLGRRALGIRRRHALMLD